MNRNRRLLQYQQELKKREEEAFKCLPRSTQWKLQLNLLKAVPLTKHSTRNKRVSDNGMNYRQRSDSSEEISSSYLNMSHSNHTYQQFNEKDLLDISETEMSLGEEVIHFPTSVDNNNNYESTNGNVSKKVGFSYLSKIERANQDNITKQRSRYEILSKKHYWSCSPLAIIQDVEKDNSQVANNKRPRKKRGSFSAGENMFSSNTDLDFSGLNGSSHRSMMKSSTSTPVNLSSFSEISTALKDLEIDNDKNQSSKGVTDHPLAENTLTEASEKKDNNIVDDVTPNSRANNEASKQSSQIRRSSTSIKTDDPLSAIALLEESNLKVKKNSELEYMRQKARMQRYAGHVKHREKLFDKKEPIPAAIAMGKDGAACAGSRWNDYYSSREVLSIIEKDLKRLPPDHHLCYHFMKQKQNETNEINDMLPQPQHPLEEIPFPKSSTTKTNVATNGTKATSQIETRGHRGMSSKNSHSNDGFDEIFDLINTLSNDDDDVKRSREERSNKLSELLFVYAKEHPALGYRQGMHEILSLVYLCLELDFFLLEKQKKLRLDCQDSSSNQNSSNSLGFGESFSSSENEIFSSNQKSLLDPNKLMHDAYSIFEAIMSQLSPAYDVESTQKSQRQHKSTNNHSSNNNNNATKSNTCSMELMGKSVLEKIKYIAADEALYNIITQMSVPPQLYCTRWVRLMFSREVVGWRNVMKLWDAFFQLISMDSNNNSNVQPNINNKQQSSQQYNVNLMNVLESTAASMICLLRNKLLPQHQLAHDGFPDPNADDHDPNECIDILMNYPPLEDISPLVSTLTSMMMQEQEFKQNSLKNRRGGIRRMSSIVSESTQNLREVFRRGSNQTDNAVNGGYNESAIETRNQSKKMNYNHNTQTIQPNRLDPHGSSRTTTVYNPERRNSRHQNSTFAGQNNRNYYDPNYRDHQNMESTNGFGNAISKLSLSVRGALGQIDSTFQNLIHEPSNQHISPIPNHHNSLPLPKVHNDPPLTFVNFSRKATGTGSNNSSPNEKYNLKNGDSNNKVRITTDQLNFNDLANRLDSSVEILLTYFNKSLQSADSQRDISIPPSIWNALSEIQDVKEHLLKKSNTK